MRTAVHSALVLALAGPAFAQGPPMPGPEHKILERNVGTWDVAMEMSGVETEPVMTITHTKHK